MTAREAARALGRADSGAYCWSRRRGLKWPDDRGSPVAKGGKVFQSGAEAAKHLGAAPNTISYHLSRHGNLDRLGARDRRYKGGNKKPITIGPETYPSQAAAARALGTHEAYLSRLIRRGRLDLLIGKALRKGMARDAAALKAREAELRASDLSHGIRELRYAATPAQIAAE